MHVVNQKTFIFVGFNLLLLKGDLAAIVSQVSPIFFPHDCALRLETSP